MERSLEEKYKQITLQKRFNEMKRIWAPIYYLKNST